MRDKVRKRLRAKRFHKLREADQDKRLIQFWDSIAEQTRVEKRRKRLDGN